MKQLKANISIQDYQRLKAIKEKYKFRSMYQIMKYLLHSFLQVADPITEADLSVNKEIEEMFEDIDGNERNNSKWIDDKLNERKRGY